MMTEQAAQVETAATAAAAASHRLRGEACRCQADHSNRYHQSIQQSTLHGSNLQNSVNLGKSRAIHDCNARHLETLHTGIAETERAIKLARFQKTSLAACAAKLVFNSSLDPTRQLGRATARRFRRATAAALAAAAAVTVEQAAEQTTVAASAGRLFLRTATRGLRRSTAARRLSWRCTRRLSGRSCTRRFGLRAAARRFGRRRTRRLRRTARAAALAALSLEQAEASIGLALKRYRNTNQDRHRNGSPNNKSAIHLNPPHEKHRAGCPKPQPHQTC